MLEVAEQCVKKIVGKSEVVIKSIGSRLKNITGTWTMDRKLQPTENLAGGQHAVNAGS